MTDARGVLLGKAGIRFRIVKLLFTGGLSSDRANFEALKLCILTC
jgi:hypothetical protein